MPSTSLDDVLITGLGIVAPIGLSRGEVWRAIESQTTGICSLPEFAEAGWIAPYGGAVQNFEPKQFVKPRKTLKVMCREMQLAAAAAELACEDAGLSEGTVDPERAGIVAAAAGLQMCDPQELADSYRAWFKEGPFDIDCFPRSAIEALSPLWLLRFLPNLNACHAGIRRDFRGPTNTIGIGDSSSLVALDEACKVIRRGTTDVMLAGGASSNLTTLRLMWHRGARLCTGAVSPEEACRPFDADRSGMVYGEGAAFFVLESRAHATRRGAKPIARIVGGASRYESSAKHRLPTGDAIQRALVAVLKKTDITADQIGHVNAHGNSTLEDDPIEAHAIEQVLGDVPVTAPKSFIGNLNAAGGAVELAMSLIALEHGQVPPTLNYTTPDEACPVNVVRQPLLTMNRTFVALNHSPSGQAAALVLTGA